VLSEAASAADSASALPNYLARIFELVQAADADSSTEFVADARINETSTAQDDISSIFIIPTSVAETITAQDTPAANTLFPASFSDAAYPSEVVISNPRFETQIDENVSAVDAAPRTNATFRVAVLESLLALDTLLGRELWEPIDDTQIPDWTDVLIATTINDVAVFGSANFGSLSFAGNLTQSYNPNPVTWVQIDDTQDTVWTDIVAV
jgi:hypothetical protein